MASESLDWVKLMFAQNASEHGALSHMHKCLQLQDALVPSTVGASFNKNLIDDFPLQIHRAIMAPTMEFAVFTTPTTTTQQPQHINSLRLTSVGLPSISLDSFLSTLNEPNQQQQHGRFGSAAGSDLGQRPNIGAAPCMGC